MIEYGNWLQEQQDENPKMSNTIMVKPLVNMFAGEYMGAEFRKRLNQQANQPQYKGKVSQLIRDAVEFYRNINAEALECKNGERIRRPSKIVEQELLLKQEKFGALKPEDEMLLKSVQEKLKL